LPKPRDRSASQYDSSPSSRRQIESTSGSGGNPLSLGGLAQLDALNAKKDRKKGWETYDEAYLQEIRAKEARLEKERKKAERGERRTDGEDEKERDTRREIERQRRKEKRKKMRQKERERENLGDDTQREEKIFRKERRRSKTQQEEVAVEEESSYEEVRNNVRLHEDWKRKQQKYERIVEPKRNVEKRERLSKSKKQRVISGPYVEDGRAEKAYRYEKKSKFSASGFDFGKYKKWMCK
jgi:glucan 1,3-beta-glucosidase